MGPRARFVTVAGCCGAAASWAASACHLAIGLEKGQLDPSGGGGSAAMTSTTTGPGPGSGGAGGTGGAGGGMTMPVYPRLALGAGHSCFRKKDDTVACWGWDGYGQLGDAGANPKPGAPNAVANGFTAKALAAGYTHTCALKAGAVSCFGSNFGGELGTAGSGHAIPAALDFKLGEVVGIAAGGAFENLGGAGHTCAVLADGTVQCWGADNHGQLGDGTTSMSAQAQPRPVVGMSGAALVALGDAHSCAIAKGGDAIRCWGANGFGQLGTGNTTQALTALPVLMNGLAGVVEVGLGVEHTCARTQSGEVWCWGGNAFGQLGLGSSDGSFHTVPGKVPGVANAVDLAVGAEFTCALDKSGAVWCWGNGLHGQLGVGKPVETCGMTPCAAKAPVKAMLPTNVVEVASGSAHGCALTGDDKVYCWGTNSPYGQLGWGDTAAHDAATPQPVVGL